jgi:ribosomal protein S18 acetylase RimI-like enzyme
MTPIFIPCPDAAALRAAIAPWLERDAVPFALPCCIAERLGTDGWAGVISVAGQVRLALVQTPPWPVALASPEPVDAPCAAVAAAVLRARASTVQAVNGPDAWAEAIVAARGVVPVARTGVRLHRLVGPPRLPRPARGEARACRSDETELLGRWQVAFQQAIEPGESVPVPSLQQLEQVRDSFLFWSVDGRPVSMAQRRRPFRGGWSIASVYTPPEYRGHGYAGALVHALSVQLLAEGATYVALYTDLDNPISNRLYARIGFVPVLDQTRISWSPA